MRSFARSRRRSSALLAPVFAGAASLVAWLAPSEALALQAFASDCNFGIKDVYNAGDPVCITGELDIVPPGKICAEGYVIVTPVGNANPFADVSKGGANYVVGCGGAGAFYDEYVWLPPLKPGAYEIVVDQYPFFGGFDPSKDFRTGSAGFVVSNAPVVFSVDPAAIKAAAQDGLKFAIGIQNLTLYLTLIDTLSTAADWAGAFGPWGGIAGLVLGVACYATEVDCPTSYNSAVIAIGNRILGGIADSLTKKYAAIIADPPDPSFDAVVGLRLGDALALGAPWTPGADRELPRGQVAVAQLLAVQSAAYEALVPSLEKLQGAQQAGSNTGRMIQAEKVKAYAQLAVDAGDAMLLELDALEAFLMSKGSLSQGPDPATVQAAIDDLDKNGFSAETEATLRSYGLGDAELAAVRAELVALPVPTSLSWAPLLKSARQSFQAMRPGLMDLVSQAEAIRTENEPYALRLAPAATLSAPASGQVGTALSLSASATHFDSSATLSYAWDTDLDGNFDNGTGATIDVTPKAPGRTLFAVKVSDPNGRFDIAHAAVDVVTTNAPPELIKLLPADPAPFAEVGEMVGFHAEASDKDGDAVTLSWRVDGIDKGTGADFVFSMPDEEPHRVMVVASDGNAYTPDASAVFVVRAAKWQNGGTGTGTGGTGAGGAGAGGSGAGATGAGGNGVDPGAGGDAGCGCRTAGASEGTSAWLLALMALGVARARRRGRSAAA